MCVCALKWLSSSSGFEISEREGVMSCVSCDLTTVTRQPMTFARFRLSGKITVSNLLSDPPDEQFQTLLQ